MNQHAQEYQRLSVATAVDNASPHQLVDMLFVGARDRINQAYGHMQQCNYEAKSAAINASIDIINGLQASLDHEQGGELADNLESLYDYMQRRLVRANADNDLGALVEVSDLVATLRSAWVSIGEQSH